MRGLFVYVYSSWLNLFFVFFVSLSKEKKGKKIITLRKTIIT